MEWKKKQKKRDIISTKVRIEGKSAFAFTISARFRCEVKTCYCASSVLSSLDGDSLENRVCFVSR